MIEALLEQVENAVDRFVAKNPLIRNDRDDLVQDTFLKILPRLNVGGDFDLPQCRAFAHLATFWTCRTALRKISNRESVKNPRLNADGVVYHKEGDGLSGPLFIDWDRVESIVERDAALFEWFAVETDREIRDIIYKQIEAKFDFLA